MRYDLILSFSVAANLCCLLFLFCLQKFHLVSLVLLLFIKRSVICCFINYFMGCSKLRVCISDKRNPTPIFLRVYELKNSNCAQKISFPNQSNGTMSVFKNSFFMNQGIRRKFYDRVCFLFKPCLISLYTLPRFYELDGAGGVRTPV